MSTTMKSKPAWPRSSTVSMVGSFTHVPKMVGPSPASRRAKLPRSYMGLPSTSPEVARYELCPTTRTIRDRSCPPQGPRLPASHARRSTANCTRPAPTRSTPTAAHTWWTRSQAMVIGWTEAQPGDELDQRCRRRARGAGARRRHAAGDPRWPGRLGRRAGRRHRAAGVVEPADHVGRHGDPGDRRRHGSGVGRPLCERERVRSERRQRRRVRTVARPARRSPHPCLPDSPTTRSPRGASGASSAARP